MINVYFQNANYIDECKFIFSMFPCGESLVKIANPIDIAKLEDAVFMKDSIIHVIFEWDSNDDLIELLLVADAIKAINPIAKTLLTISYFPYARQDRVANPGEPHSARVISKLFNSCEFDSVQLMDPHSDVLEALINNVHVIAQDQLFIPYFEQNGFNYDAVVSPDGGAYKKVSKFAKLIAKSVSPHIEVIRADKIRNTLTGHISDIEVYTNKEQVNGYSVMILDDICDGGGTFIGLAQKLKELGVKQVDLYVTYGMFTQGVTKLLKYVDNIYCVSYNGPIEDDDKINIIPIK